MAPENPRRIVNLPGFSESNRQEWKRRLLSFSFFLAISILIWVFNALSKNYTTEIRYPITYSHFPQNKLQVSELPEYLYLKVSAHGYTLLNYKWINRPVPINFKVSTFAMNQVSNDPTKYFMLTRYAREQVDKQLPSELQLLEINPDSLIFQFAAKVQKRLAVAARIDYQIQKDFTQMGPVQIKPDSITIIGPDILLDTMKYIYTEEKSLGVLDKSYSENLSLQIIKGLVPDYKNVDCNIELEKYTEIQLNVPVQIIGLPDTISIQTFPSSVKVRAQVGLSNYERVVSEAFWVEVDFADVSENKTRLKVEMRTAPDFLSNVNFYPQTVEYILSVKK